MASIIINKIVEANVYLNGNNQAGKATEVKFPSLQMDMQETDALGMAMTISLPGKLKELEGEITWNSVYPEVEELLLNPFNGVPLMLRSNLRRYASAGLVEEVPMATFITIMPHENELGELNMKDAQKRPVKYKVLSLRQVVDGVEILHLDPWNNIYRVKGNDIFEKMRRNIGA